MIFLSSTWEFSSVGRVPALQAEGHRFESYNSHQNEKNGLIVILFFIRRMQRILEGSFEGTQTYFPLPYNSHQNEENG